MQPLKKQEEYLVEEYKIYVDKIISHTYRYADIEKKEELRQLGMIGLWKGIRRYYAREAKAYDEKEFVDTICAYIRYEMKRLPQYSSAIRISSGQYRNFIRTKKLKSLHPNLSQDEFEALMKENGLRCDWYQRAKQLLYPASLDQYISEDEGECLYTLLPQHDCVLESLPDKSYLAYIIRSALAGIKPLRDKDLILTWLCGIYCDKEPSRTQLAKQYDLSAGTVGNILRRFIHLCCFVRDCEKEFQNNPDGCVYFPVLKERDGTYNGQKIHGVRWAERNKKWKAEITISKRKCLFIGYFERYQDAVQARRDAEIRYRGKSNIRI